MISGSNRPVRIVRRFRADCILFALLCIAFTSAADLYNGIYPGRQWHDLDRTRSITLNPAFAATETFPALSSAFSTSQMGLFYLMNAQLVLPLSPRAYGSHTMGIAYTGLHAGSLETSSWDNRYVSYDKAGKQTYSEQYGTLSYAFMPIGKLALGISGNVVRKTNFGQPLVDGSVDAGVNWTIENGSIGRHQLHATFFNPGKLSRLTGAEFTSDIGVGWNGEGTLWGVHLSAGVEALLHGNKKTSSEMLLRRTSARVGANLLRKMTCFVQGGRDYLGISATIDLDSTLMSLPANLRKVSGAYQVLFTREQIKPSNTLYLSMEINKNRNVLFGDLYEVYQKAMMAFSEEKYGDAWAMLEIIQSEDPDFFKIWDVRYTAALCLEKMNLYDESTRQYLSLKEDCLRQNAWNESSFVGKADAGLLRNMVKTTDSVAVIRQFEQLLESQAADSVKLHACYVIGQYYVVRNDSARAIAVLGRIHPNHPDFAFARYTMGICQFTGNDTSGNTVRHFKAAIEAANSTPAELELRSRAAYALACYYYERNRFADAQHYVEMIPDSSTVYYQGLSVVAWSLLKNRQWSRCRVVAQEMQKSFNVEMQAEGTLLEGYALISDGECPQTRELCLAKALDAADRAVKLTSHFDMYTQTDPLLLRQQNDSLVKVQWKYLAEYKKQVLQGADHAALFRKIDGMRPVVRFCHYRNEVNKINLDIHEHYRLSEKQLAAMKENIDYFAAKVKMLYEREVVRNSVRPGTVVRRSR